ncbi:DUF2931 family protein [Halopseudomonas aestusnigri]|uniref:DUF2931 family protein n=1 Tax=Halopseudomonas aestusnigri TaxID=857252 RepID=A0AAQ1JRG7_9GAMM|nr:DUF2931 family protein [Halopseudomonas aestusnigri]OWL84713.1 hypothetical protein B7O88_15885 [Halopseudomonas aestusnigri]SEG68436.1 Protein of unknown function [Halopseudomonas aestusnigri]
MIKHLAAWLTVLWLSGCSSHTSLAPFPPKPDLPYRAWYVGLQAPDYMEAWVEQIDLTDVNDLMYEDVFGGVASTRTPADNRGDARGWPENPGPGSSFPMTGIDLPAKVTVRWQSLAEPQVYRASFNLSQATRAEMVKPRNAYCAWRDEHEIQYLDTIAIGVAPGGVVKAWLVGPCLDAVEIAHVQGEINPVGPYNGKSNGEFYRPPSPNAQHYIDTHGIPFGSW